MRTLRKSATAVAMVGLLIATEGCAGTPHGPVAQPPDPVASPVQPLGATSDLTVVASPVSSAPCNANAAATPAADGTKAIRDLIANNPASNLHEGAPILGDADAAVAAARASSSTIAEARSMGWEQVAQPRAAAVLLPYQATVKAAGAEIPEGSQIVNPQRCVWLVTVDEPYVQQHVKAGIKPQVFDRYTRVIDQATGEGLDFYAGPDLPDAITGSRF
ncbi:MAG: hypothetical protein J0I14_06920 [Propionibacteriaceae bacterium]|nr:hypothetical protein [Propionibacteriaceae bacterium]